MVLSSLIAETNTQMAKHRDRIRLTEHRKGQTFRTEVIVFNSLVAETITQ